MIRTARDILFSAFFPQPCFCCKSDLTTPSLGNACGSCWSKCEIFDGSQSLCIKCGRPDLTDKRVKCWQCDGHEYDTACSVGVYSFGLRAAVVGLKTEPYISQQLAGLLHKTFERNELADATLIVPVPLSRQRKLERGFNQADVIAQTLAKHSGIPLDTQSLVRTKHSPIHRAGMDEKARDLSVRDSFAVVRPKLFEGKTILLVDDVLTTGSTASYCAKAIKRTGACKVNVLTIARAI